MGADGGIIGLKLRKATQTSSEAMAELVKVVPFELQHWDDSEHYPYREAEAVQEAGHWYSTYGSFQTWDLGQLPELVVEAKAYAEKHPEATFGEWAEDIYTSQASWPYSYFYGWEGWVQLLADRYLGVSTPQGMPHPPEDRDYYGALFSMRVADWVVIVEKHLDLEVQPHREETWT